MKCVECAADIGKLFEEPVKGNITLVNCENCGKIADKYIEYEYTLIFLNLILCKIQVYRHVLFNADFCDTAFEIFKLFALSCFLDTVLQSCEDFPCFVVEFARCVLKNSVYLLGIFLCASVSGLKVNTQSLIRAVLLASYGKLGAFMILTWKYSLLHRSMMSFFIYLNNMISVREAINSNSFQAFTFVLVALVISSADSIINYY